MHLSRIQLRDFRNYREATLAAPPGFILVEGPNGAGKTNLLEAIYFLAVCKSFRTTRDGDLVRDGAERTVVRATACGRAGDVDLELTYAAVNGKRAAVNGSALPRLLDFVGTLAVVAFTPEDLDLVKGEPAARRRFMDVWLGQQSREYLYYLQRYYDVLRRRNALLNTAPRAPEREGYDVELITAGVHLTGARARAIAELAPAAQDAYAELAPAGEAFQVKYSPSVEYNEGIAATFTAALVASRYDEERRGQTLIGPHRDDVNLAINGDDARRFASEGQSRTAALALRLAQFRVFKRKTGDAPVMLLDDVGAELDERRRFNLYAELAAADQAWYASPAAPDAPAAACKLKIYDGVITIES